MCQTFPSSLGLFIKGTKTSAQTSTALMSFLEVNYVMILFFQNELSKPPVNKQDYGLNEVNKAEEQVSVYQVRTQVGA